jgi:formylglycine-generating enzyme required for sulfatase activity
LGADLSAEAIAKADRRVRRRQRFLPTLKLLAACVSTACSGSGSTEGNDGGSGDHAACDLADRVAVSDVVVACPEGMAYVPAGEFLMGADPAEADPDVRDNLPEHVVWISAFCLDVNEVTVADWNRCVDAGSCVAPHCATGAEDLPVGCVAHDEARTFCAWAGKRLPTEAEWEKAARGGCEIAGSPCCEGDDERLLPWGDDPWWVRRACEFAVCSLCPGLQPPGGRLLGAGPYGHLDLLGNVMEWTANRYAPADYAACGSPCTDPTGPSDGELVVARGGDFGSVCERLSVQRRFPVLPETRYRGLGFRCAIVP